MTTGVVVSVILPYLRAERTIERALRSVLAQSMSELEIIAICDGSSDGSLQIVEEHRRSDARVRSIVLPANVGPGAARNRGIEEATGAWIALLDADDWFAKDRLERLLDAAGDAPIVVDNLMGVDPADGSLTGPVFPAMPPAISFEDVAAPTAPGSQYNYGYLKPMVRKAFIDAHGIRYDERLRTAEDLILLLECSAETGSMRVSDQAGYFYTLQRSPKKGRISASTHSVPNDRLIIGALERIESRRASRLTDRQRSALRQRKAFLAHVADISSFRHAVLSRQPVRALNHFRKSRDVRSYVFGHLLRRMPVKARSPKATAGPGGDGSARGTPWRRPVGPAALGDGPSPWRVAVCIATYRRPAQLAALLRALGRQVDAPAFTIVVGNNEPQSLSVYPELTAPGLPVHTVIDVAVRGVTAVRNAMITHVLTRTDVAWIACIDDDQTPADDWLARLVEAGDRYHADLVGGPVAKTVAAPTFWSTSAADTSYLPAAEGPVESLNEAGNLLLSTRFLRSLSRPPFDEDYGRTGGEDYEFFLHAKSRGASMAWAPAAKVVEALPADRLTLRGYAWRFYSIAAYQARADRSYFGVWPTVGRTVFEAFKAPLILGRSLLSERNVARAVAIVVRTSSVTAGRIVGLLGTRAERYGHDH